MSFVNSIVNQVFVINMDKDTERLKKITAVLSRQNITFERIPGVPGKDVKHDDRLTDFCNNFCADSAKGCALSHRNAWDIAYERGYESILVFEDDADIPDDLSVQLQSIWHTKPDDYDIISLGIECFGRENNNVYHIFQNITGLQATPYNNNFLSVKGQLGTHALIISKQGIEKLRSHKINTHIDIEITIWSIQYNNLNIYTVDTFTIDQNDNEFESNNSPSKKYPTIANYMSKQIPISHYRNLDYQLHLQIFKLGFLKLTNILLLLFFLILFIPPIYKYGILAYLILELIVTPSLSEASPYFTVWTAAFLISYPFYGNNFKNIKRFIKAATR